MTRPRPERSFERIVTACATHLNVRSTNRGDESVGLLFIDTVRERHDDLDELSRIMRHPDVETLFGRAVMGLRVLRGYKHAGYSYWRNQEKAPEGDAWLVTPDVTACFLAEPSPPRPVYFRYGSVILTAETTMRTWDEEACWMLTKTFGCEKCPMHGAECLWANLDFELKVLVPEPDDPRQLALPGVPFGASLQYVDVAALKAEAYQAENNEHVTDWGTWRDNQQPKLKQIAGYTYVNPLLTCQETPAPDAQGCRPPAEHFVSAIDDAREAVAQRTAKRNHTHALIQRECRHCLFGYCHTYPTDRRVVNPCKRWNPGRCEHGAWDRDTAEDVLTEYTLTLLENSLRGSDYTLDDVWRLANVCGQPFLCALPGRRSKEAQEWILCHLTQRYHYGDLPKGSHLQVLARPTGRYARQRNTEILVSKEAVYNFLPSQLREVWRNPPPLDRTLLALWLHVAVTSSGASRRSGWGNFSPDHGFCGVHLGSYHQVFTELWASRDEGQTTFRSFKMIYDYYDKLPWIDILAKEDPEQKSGFWER